MTHLHATALLETPAVALADVRCTAPRSGCGPAEWCAEARVVVPRRGAFVVHGPSGPLVADAASAVVFGRGEEHRISHPADGGDRCTVLAAPPATLEEALGTLAGRRGALRTGTQLALHRLAAAAGAGARGLAAEEAALRVLAAIARDLGTARAVDAGRTARRRVEAVRALLASDPGARWGLDDVARAVACSPFHLARQFRAASGESIGRHLLRLRVALALDRLAEGEGDLARLGAELGFSHHSHFSARFGELAGLPPREVRTILTAGAAAAP